MAKIETLTGLESLYPDHGKIIKDFARATKEILKENLIAEYLFGSYAVNEQKALSDIDILLIVKNYSPGLHWQVSELSSNYSLQYDLCFSPIFQDTSIWEKNRINNTLFFQEINEHGILL